MPASMSMFTVSGSENQTVIRAESKKAEGSSATNPEALTPLGVVVVPMGQFPKPEGPTGPMMVWW